MSRQAVNNTVHTRILWRAFLWNLEKGRVHPQQLISEKPRNKDRQNPGKVNLCRTSVFFEILYTVCLEYVPLLLFYC